MPGGGEPIKRDRRHGGERQSQHWSNPAILLTTAMWSSAVDPAL